jgi:hypothetical protein
MDQPWHDPNRTQTPAGRLREILGYMNVPSERVQPLDLAWLADNLGRWSKSPHYQEARQLCVQLLRPDRNGHSRRVR